MSTSENGWTDDFLCIEWFNKSFLPQAKERNVSGKKILLIYDGHGSHDQYKLIQSARENGVILLCLPPHTTHKLQPLDVGVFGPFARAWIERCDDIVEDTGQEMPREDFVKEYMAVRNASFKESTLRTAWRKSGLWPINRDIFRNDDYAPSVATSTHASAVPSSYPTHQSFSDDEDNLTDTEQSSPSNVHPNTTAVTSTPTFSPTLMSPIPPSLFYETPSRRTPLNSRKRTYEDIEKENNELWTRLKHSEAHSAMAHSQLQDATRKLNAKDGKAAKRPKLNVEARCLTSREGMEAARKQSEAKAAELQKKKESQEMRDAKEAERQELRRKSGSDATFTGSLSSKSKDDLKDIVYALNLSLEGSKDELVSRIKQHFDVHPTLRDDPRYQGMFVRTRMRPRPSSTLLPQPSSLTLLSQPSTSTLLSQPSSSTLPLPRQSSSLMLPPSSAPPKPRPRPIPPPSPVTPRSPNPTTATLHLPPLLAHNSPSTPSHFASAAPLPRPYIFHNPSYYYPSYSEHGNVNT